MASAERPLRSVARAPVSGSRRGGCAADRVAGAKPTERDRRLMAAAVRHGRLVPSQAWRWEWPASPSIRPARNRLGSWRRRAGCVHVPLRRGEGVYVPTPAGARLVAELTGGCLRPRRPPRRAQRWLAQLGHDLTVAEAERWLLSRRAPPGPGSSRSGSWSGSGRARCRPRRRHGAAGMRFRPDGAVVLPTGERIAVEVELHAKGAERLGDKLRWYRDEAGYAEVLWLVPGAGVEGPLWEAIAGVDPKAELMAVETLPPGCLIYVR